MLPRTWKDSQHAEFGGWFAIKGGPGLPWAPYQPYTSRIYPTPGNERPVPSNMRQLRVVPKDRGLLDLELSKDPHLRGDGRQDRGVRGAEGRAVGDVPRAHGREGVQGAQGRHGGHGGLAHLLRVPGGHGQSQVHVVRLEPGPGLGPLHRRDLRGGEHTKLLWDANISAEFSQQDNPKIRFEITSALERDIPFMVLAGQEEAREGKCKVKDLRARTEDTVELGELVATLRGKGTVPVGCQFAMELPGRRGAVRVRAAPNAGQARGGPPQDLRRGQGPAPVRHTRVHPHPYPRPNAATRLRGAALEPECPPGATLTTIGRCAGNEWPEKASSIQLNSSVENALLCTIPTYKQ